MQSLMLDLSAALCKLYCSTIWKLEVINRGLEVTPRAIIILVFAHKDSPIYIDECTARRMGPLCMEFVLLVNKINLLIQQGKGAILSN